MKKLKSGYINGTRVMLGSLGDFLNTSAITDLSFLGSQEDGYPDSKWIHILISTSVRLLIVWNSFVPQDSIQIFRHISMNICSGHSVRRAQSIFDNQHLDLANCGVACRAKVQSRRLDPLMLTVSLIPFFLSNMPSLSFHQSFVISFAPSERWNQRMLSSVWHCFEQHVIQYTDVVHGAISLAFKMDFLCNSCFKCHLFLLNFRENSKLRWWEKSFGNFFLIFFSTYTGDTLGMEGNVIERRPSTSQQNWFENKQQSYTNIFVTPPNEADRVRLEKMTDGERDASLGKIVIKDRHEGMQKQPESRHFNTFYYLANCSTKNSIGRKRAKSQQCGDQFRRDRSWRIDCNAARNRKSGRTRRYSSIFSGYTRAGFQHRYSNSVWLICF